MQLFLDELSKIVPTGKHAVLITDQAGWHKTPKLISLKIFHLFFYTIFT